MDRGFPASHGVPGLQSTKGDHIYKALQKLWARIIELELKSKNEKNGSGTNKESENNSDENLHTLQTKLLKLQQKYIDKLLKERQSVQLEPNVAPASNFVDGIPPHLTSSTSSSETDSNYNDLDVFPSKLQETAQAPNNTPRDMNIAYASLLDSEDGSSADKNIPVNRNERIREPKNSVADSVTQPSCSKTLSQRYHFSEPTERSGRTRRDYSTSGSFAKTSKIPQVKRFPVNNQHYHMKLSDVPFIVGKSTGASHSVIANVQSIIGMMKTHCPALCTAPIPEEKRKALESRENNTELRKLKKELKKLAKELSDMTSKQEMLKQKLSQTQQFQDKTSVSQEYNGISKLMELKAKEIVKFHKKLKQESEKQTQPKEIFVTSQETYSRGCGKPCGKTIEVGTIKRLKSARSKRIGQEELRVEDIEWT